MVKLVAWAVVLGLGLAAGCASSEVPEYPVPPDDQLMGTEGSEAQPQAPDLAQHMQRSFWAGIDARDALIAADLPAAKRAAARLAAEDPGAFPKDWKHWVQTINQHADELAMAPDLESAAQALAAVGRTCGQCHWHLHAGPKAERPELQDPPDVAEPLEDRMLRHEVAAEEMWLGLVKPSHALWRQGTVTLTRAPLQPPTQDGQEVSPEMAEGVEALRALAKDGRAAKTMDERAAAYAAIITRCGQCHYQPPK